MKNSELAQEMGRLRRRYNVLKKEQEDMEKEMDFLKSVDYSRPHVSGGDSKDISDLLIELDERKERSARKLLALYNRITSIESYLKRKLTGLSDPDGEEVLYNLFTLGHAAQETARILHFSRTTIYEKKSKALIYLDSLPCDYSPDSRE
ncbi:hypothetical protein [Dialister sp.]|jgi:hypothetical protein|uniref:hypothetical protein n=1 Tax=Dialister sp. TaxID=1955814 RepID=UPI003A5C2032